MRGGTYSPGSRTGVGPTNVAIEGNGRSSPIVRRPRRSRRRRRNFRRCGTARRAAVLRCLSRSATCRRVPARAQSPAPAGRPAGIVQESGQPSLASRWCASRRASLFHWPPTQLYVSSRSHGPSAPLGGEPALQPSQDPFPVVRPRIPEGPGEPRFLVEHDAQVKRYQHHHGVESQWP